MQDPEFAEFADAQTSRLLGLAYALTGNRHDAWDLTQETLARLAERWRRVHTDPVAYSRTVMVRLNIDRIRHLRRELLSGATPDRAAPAQQLGEVDAWLVEALATLSARQRTALALRHVEDLDVGQIADRMGCSIGTAKSHLSRGTHRLKEYAAAAGLTARAREETR